MGPGLATPLFVASASCQLFNTCCDRAVSFGLYSCLYRKYVLFVDTDLQQSESLLSHECLQRNCTATDGRLFCFLCSLKAYDIFFECFIASAYSELYVPDIVFKVDTLPICDFFKDRLVSQARPFPFPQQLPITYQIRVLEAINAAERKGSGL